MVKQGEVNISDGAGALWSYGNLKLLTETLVLNIKLATFNLIFYFGVSSVIMLSHRYLLQLVQDEL